MVTKLDYAFLSWAAYPENLSQIPDDNKWKVLKTSENADTSFAAVAFGNSDKWSMQLLGTVLVSIGAILFGELLMLSDIKDVRFEKIEYVYIKMKRNFSHQHLSKV